MPSTHIEGWKLQTVCLPGTGKNGARQVKILDTFREERLKLWKLLSAYLLGTDKNSAGQVDIFDTFPKERLNYFAISTPDIRMWYPRYFTKVTNQSNFTYVCAVSILVICILCVLFNCFLV